MGSDWNEEIPRFKAKKKGIIDTKAPVGKGKKRPRPWRVMTNSAFGYGKKPYVAHRAASEDAAKAWIEKQRRSYYVPYRCSAPDVIEHIKARHEERVSRYWIEGPKE